MANKVECVADKKLAKYVGLPDGYHVELVDDFFGAYSVFRTSPRKEIRFVTSSEYDKIQEFLNKIG